MEPVRKSRHSNQRDKIYEYLCCTEQHPSAEMIYDNLKKSMPSLSLATVYRNLKFLEKEGKIKRVITPGNTERYDYDMSEHAHFICRHCGQVKNLRSIPIDRNHMEGLDPEDLVEKCSINLIGICGTCRKLGSV